MKKRWMKIVIMMIVLILFIPVPIYAKDGGTVCYQAILYSVTDYHSMKENGGFNTGIEIKILGIVVYSNTTFD